MTTGGDARPTYLPVATDFMEGSEMGSKFTNFLRHLMAPRRKEATDRESEKAVRESEKAVDYKGYTIRPILYLEGSQWLTAGVITKQFADGVKEHRFVRADTHGTKDDAEAFSIAKAKKIVDEQGDRLFQDG